MKKSLALSRRQRRREYMRKYYGNPWDSSSKTSSRKSSSHKSSSHRKSMKFKTAKKSSIKTGTRSKRNVSFREPIERSRSSSSSHNSVWRTVSSEK